MRNVLWFQPAILAIALLSGCATGPTIRVDKDPAAKMTAYKSFGFFDRLGTDRAQYSTIVTSWLKQAIRTQMERIGYAYNEKDPDLHVNFFLNVEEKQEIRSAPSSMGPGFYGYRGGMYGAWGGYPYDIETITYNEGTLSIDLVDAKKKALVWQGLAEGRVKDESIRNPGPAIDKVVGEIFSNFPNPPAE
ncbi:MAG: DUF4136 domain-containing protein [Methylococcaceae bacterium]|nr:DUF4136 domain-containing protein [Methylococcaceae bacterium]